MFGKYINMGDAIFISIFSMVIVFLTLLIISYIIDFVSYVLKKAKERSKKNHG